MKEKRLQVISAVLYAVLFIAGIIIILNSIKTGNIVADNILRQNGGMNTEKYIVYLRESICTFRELGITLSILGGIGGIVSFASYKADKASGTVRYA